MHNLRYNGFSITTINSVFYTETKEWDRDFFAPRSSEALVLFTKGAIEYHFADKDIVAREGQLLLLPGVLPYSGKQLSDEVAFYVIDFSCVDPYGFELFGAPCTLTLSNPSRLISICEDALDAWLRQPTGVTLRLKSMLYSTLHTIVNDQHTVETSDNKRTSTAKILSYIAENIGNTELTVKHLCDKFYISESQLRRNITKETGFAPNEYIQILRINKAKSELSYTQKPIQQIAVKCGFSSPYYFSNCMTKHTGMSPSKYRKSTSM